MYSILKDFNYKFARNGTFCYKTVFDASGNVICSVMFSKVHGHYPLTIKYYKHKPPKLKWSNKSARVFVDKDNVKQLAENVEKAINDYNVVLNNWKIDYALSKLK